MSEISKQDIQTLVKLQEAESEIVRLTKVLDKVEKEKQKIGLQIKAFETALEKNKQELLASENGCRGIEAEIQLIDDRIIKSNEKLRMVKTNKEYQLLLREVDDNKKRKDMLETELIESMEQKEKLTLLVEERETEFQLLNDKVKAEQSEIDKKTSDDKELLNEYLEQQAEIGKNLSPSLMTRFAKISKMNNGLAVTTVKNEVCMGCFMNIPPQMYIDVQRGKSLISCPQCSRILYFENS
ncbi:MAG: C4-type zinc ribbon domain-containing protein [Desulfobacterales bacterium]|nr:C4-type zinc ribbon domain-containing protein [Desulfobacterales bacterium]